MTKMRTVRPFFLHVLRWNLEFRLLGPLCIWPTKNCGTASKRALPEQNEVCTTRFARSASKFGVGIILYLLWFLFGQFPKVRAKQVVHVYLVLEAYISWNGGRSWSSLLPVWTIPQGRSEARFALRVKQVAQAPVYYIYCKLYAHMVQFSPTLCGRRTTIFRLSWKFVVAYYLVLNTCVLLTVSGHSTWTHNVPNRYQT